MSKQVNDQDDVQPTSADASQGVPKTTDKAASTTDATEPSTPNTPPSSTTPAQSGAKNSRSRRRGKARPLRVQPLLAALPAQLNRQIPHPAAQPHLPRAPLNPAHLPQAGRLLVRHRQAPPRQSRPAASHRRALRRPPATKAAVTAKAVGAKAAASQLPW